MSSLILAIGLLGGAAAQSATTELDPVQPWVVAAKANHPDNEAAREQLAAARDEIGGTRAWMPPNSQFLYKSDGTKELSLTQMVPGPGKLNSQTRVARERVAMTRADSARREVQLELAVRESAWMEWMAHAKIEVFAEQDTLAVRLVEAVRRLQAQGMATASEAWLAQAKVHQTRIDAERAKAEERSTTAMRESWTGPGEPMRAKAAVAPDWSDSALARAATERPDIQAMKSDAAMKDAMGDGMRTSLRPDFMVGGMVMQMPNGMAGWGVMAGMTLPFVPWASGMATSEASNAHARARAAQADAQTMERMAKAQVAEHVAKARAAWSALIELDSLLPGQDRAVADARARYSQGREMLAMVLQMEDMVRMTRMEAIMRRGDYELERARLYAAAGLSLLSSPTDATSSVRGDTTEVTP